MKYAIYTKNSFDKGMGNKLYGTYLVGSKEPNAWGLYDMTGNVWELCMDWYDSSYYGKSPKKNPKGPLTGSSKIKRGGSWSSNVSLLKSGKRLRVAPFNKYWDLGLRIVKNQR